MGVTLSIIIVNYNVKYFLDQCLESVFHSQRTLEGDAGTLELEVFVVDNHSVDGSVEMVRQRYPQVHLIANKDNCGFAAANNQALRQCSGDLVLLLNPDTLVERDTLCRCADFFAQHSDCGGLTVKMVNGEGKYLKESKRGFPTPAASFYKMSGLTKLFPHSRRFAAYYMGHLDDDETNPVDILPGAFLMLSRESLKKVGLLDEAYFMYGEDIDFSWRIRLAGYKNYYFPEVRIIHYKGESTKHSSMNYVYTFYNAMSIFVSHYYSGGNAKLFNGLLQVAIWLRAGMAWARRVLQAVALPTVDFAVACAGFIGIKQLWAAYWASNVNYYPPEYTWLVIPCYVLWLMLFSWLYGGYEKPVRLLRIIKGMAVGGMLLLVFYSLLSENLRYSRMLLMLGCVWTLASSLGIRGVLSLMRVNGFDLRNKRQRRCVVVGGKEESERVGELYQQLAGSCVETLSDKDLDSRRLNEAILYYKADEVIFCSKDLSIKQIIDLMTEQGRLPGRKGQAEYKIVPSDSDFIIGSNSINSTEDLYTEELRTIAQPLNRRNKRLLDLTVALLLFILSPALIWFQRHKKRYLRDCRDVLIGKKTWVGTSDGETKPGVFGPEDALPGRVPALNTELKNRLQLRYLRNYKLSTDLLIITKNLRSI